MPEYKTVEYATERNLDVTPVSVQNVKALMPEWNRKFDEWGENVEASINEKIQVEIAKIDPDSLIAVRAERVIMTPPFTDNKYYPAQEIEIVTYVRLVRIFATEVEMYSVHENETFLEGDGYTVRDGKVYIPAEPRNTYVKVYSKYQIPVDSSYWDKVIELEAVFVSDRSIDVASAYFPMVKDPTDIGNLSELSITQFQSVANMAAANPSLFMSLATQGKTININWTGIGEIPCRIVGVGHYQTPDGGRSGFTLQPTVIPFTESSPYSSSSRYECYNTCKFASEEDNYISKYLPVEWRKIIQQVLIVVANRDGVQDASYPSKIFPPSVTEMGITYSNTFKCGSLLPYWASHSTQTDRILNIKTSSSPGQWVLRDVTKAASYPVVVYTDGSITAWTSTLEPTGYAPFFNVGHYKEM